MAFSAASEEAGAEADGEAAFMRRKIPLRQSGKRGFIFLIARALSRSDIPALKSIRSFTAYRRISFFGSFQTSTPATWMPTRLPMPWGSEKPVSTNSVARG